jgi:hypothetical protein
MPLTIIPLPYGVRDVKIFPLTGDVPAVLGIDFPNARTFSFSEAEDFEELRGDDGVVAVHGSGPSVDWELEGGGFSFEATKAMYGGAIVESGTTPAIKKTINKRETDIRPYFQLEGQAISDSGGDFHVTLFKCRCTGELSGEMADGGFWLTGASGRAIGRGADRDIYQITQNETAVAIGAPETPVTRS